MDWLGAEIADADGHPYARLDDVFVGRTSGEPEFGIVALFDQGPGEAGRVAVPLTRARRVAGGSLDLGVDRARVVAAPRVQGDVEEIPAPVGKLILQHFGVADAPGGSEDETIAVPRVTDTDATEVIRHEEQLSVGTRAEATERVRVRKRVVTEEVTLTVQLRREELIIDRETIPEGAPGISAPSDFPLAEDGGEIEFVLHAEEPVVTKKIVAVERVRINRETTTEDRHIADTVRKERVDVDQLTATREDHPR